MNDACIWKWGVTSPLQSNIAKLAELRMNVNGKDKKEIKRMNKIIFRSK